jgi:hypothetical protein
MAFADTLGAYGPFLNLPEGVRTTTIESKTNFFAAGRSGSTVLGESTPLHKGRSTMVWQTRVTNNGGSLIGLVTQTQIVAQPERSAEDELATLFAGTSIAEQQELLARLERSGAAMYRALGLLRKPTKRERPRCSRPRSERSRTPKPSSQTDLPGQPRVKLDAGTPSVASASDATWTHADPRRSRLARVPRAANIPTLSRRPGVHEEVSWKKMLVKPFRC